jgi:hypothetical protein
MIAYFDYFLYSSFAEFGVAQKRQGECLGDYYLNSGLGAI